MKSPQERPRWLDAKENVTKVARALYVVCALAVLAALIIHRHAEVGADAFFGFYGLYGFIGSVFLVLAAKQLRKLLKRSEDYYDV